MNIALNRTKAETALTEQFERIGSGLPGDAAVADQRKQAIGTFASLGFPHRRIEEWKYTDLRAAVKEVGDANISAGHAIDPAAIEAALGPLSEIDAHRIVIVDDHYRAEFSHDESIPGLHVRTLANALAAGEFDTAFAQELAGPSAAGMLSLNTAFMSDGAIITVDAGTKLHKPVFIVTVSADAAPQWTSLRSRVQIGAEASLTLVEVALALPGAAPGQRNHVTEVTVGDRAHVTHVIAGLEPDQTAVANVAATTGTEAVYRPFFFTAGPALTRNQLALRFDGEDGKLDCSGAFLGRGNAHVDNTLIIDHAVPGCQSRELFKGVLDDRARGVFQGKVIVRQIAQKTDGKQMAQALMLSQDAEFDSKPELEIYADDVACGHGSTCAEIDPEHVFYLRARGIPADTARALLVEAFVTEAIEQIEHDAVADALSEIARAWLRQDAS